MAARAQRSKATRQEIRALLFDADRADHAVELTAGTLSGLKDHQLLWVDAPGATDSRATTEMLGLLPLDSGAVERFLKASSGPRLELHGDYFQLRVATTSAATPERTGSLDLIAGKNFVTTIHADGVPFLADFDDRIEQDTSLGLIDSAAFTVVLLDGLLTGYLAIADELEADVDRLDEEALKPNAVRDLLGEMVALRHRISAVRHVLSSHREVFAALARPDFETITESPAMDRFVALAERFERAIDAVEASREALVGTFGIYSTRTAQRTNDIVKILTIVSVLLLPTTVIAGFMGMNIKAPYSNDDPTIFWFVLALIVAIAAGTLIVLRLRRWL